MRLALLTLVLPLAACVTPDSYTGPGNRQADMDGCMSQATRDVPPRPDYAGIDLNHEIRMRAFDACMSERGYSKS